MIKRLVQVAVPALTLALATTLSGCSLMDVKEDGDADISITWVTPGNTCKIRGHNQAKTGNSHWLPSDSKPGVYNTKVCRGGTPLAYTLWEDGRLRVRYRVPYTITEKVDRGTGICTLKLTPRDPRWEPDKFNRGMCGKLNEGDTYIQEKESETAMPIDYQP